MASLEEKTHNYKNISFNVKRQEKLFLTTNKSNVLCYKSVLLKGLSKPELLSSSSRRNIERIGFTAFARV
jgi:hypothetical protein